MTGPGVEDMPARITKLVAAHVFSYATEDGLQEALAGVLTAAGLPAQREVRLTPTARIDLMVGTVGVEVKVRSTPAQVLRQLTRYAATGQVTALVLVTTRALHLTLNGKVLHGIPVRVVRPAWM